MAKHKAGETISVSNVQMIIPNIGNLVDLTVDGENYVGRILQCNERDTQIKLVGKDTKE